MKLLNNNYVEIYYDVYSARIRFPFLFVRENITFPDKNHTVSKLQLHAKTRICEICIVRTLCHDFHCMYLDLFRVLEFKKLIVTVAIVG